MLSWTSGRGKSGKTQGTYRRAMKALNAEQAAYLVGGSHALEHHTGVARHTKDFDIFVRRRDCRQVLNILGEAGFRTETTFSHWLAKAFDGDNLIDVIFSSGNGMCPVDDEWFEHATDVTILDVPAWLCPAEEMIWQKAFIFERDRCDAADIAHMILYRGPDLDWTRILRRFGEHWRLLLVQLILFGFVYTGRRSCVPAEVMQELMARLRAEPNETDLTNDQCLGPLLSVLQYDVDVTDGEFKDARLFPAGGMSAPQIAQWTAAFRK